MRKQVMGFLAGALFVSGIGFAASEFTANAGIKVLADKPASMRGESILPAQELAGMMGDQVGIDEGSIKLDAKPGKEQPGQRSSGSDSSQFKPLPLTRTVNDVEVTIHSIRVTEKNTDFEVTIKNNSDKEKVTLQLDEVMTEANIGVAGKAVEAVEAAADNPDFKDKAIRPTKELHGWVRHQGLKDRDIANLSFRLALKGTKETRTYHFLIDCTKLKFRTL
ncbi:hypothetical protein L3476_28780 [Paenibacillus thiaminolyticus]|uniref:hypothetical protein n=1 Tax=Paenibacillus thiaminolyticus TaxID=49283 RepID=UPI00234FDE29|nr:hypothetical protein [Paenibacillus thiaminolyticus]WCR27116.1 hypothetical protein L3476_28780 [Paenibacillus thiaminolyticus]